MATHTRLIHVARNQSGMRAALYSARKRVIPVIKRNFVDKAQSALPLLALS